jgi:spermidine/putrescine transport system ATP-binding protein
MSDRVAVMNEGRIIQTGPTNEIYNHPATPFVASFVGEQNMLEGQVVSLDDQMAQIETPLGNFVGQNRDGLSTGDKAMLFVRPERVKLVNGAAIDNQLDVEIERHDLEGPFLNVFMRANDHRIVMHMTNRGDAATDVTGKQSVGFSSEDTMIMRAGALADE